MTASRLAQNTAITIGNFDGVHVGHAALVQAARLAVDSGEDAGRVVAIAFDPNPITVLRPDVTAPSRLTTFEQRTRWLRAAGADEVVRIEPTREFLQQSPDQFLQSCVERWRPCAIIEGADFRFGKGRAGSIDTLREFEAQFDYRTIVVDPVEVALVDHAVVRASSSLMRWLLAHGRVQDVSVVLGRDYELESTIVKGDQRGLTIGFPTANLAPVDQLLPADGIYAGIASRDGCEWPAAISIGTKPTFGECPRTCEAFLLDYDGPVNDYGWNIQLRFTHWLRDQLRYDNVDALIAQLHRDIAAARACAQQSPGMAIPRLFGARRT